MKRYSFLLSVLLLALLSLVPSSAVANHPDDDDRAAVVLDGAPWWQTGRDDPVCDFDNSWGEYGSMDWEFWRCTPDPGVPGVPGSAGPYWEPIPTDFDNPDYADPDSPDDLGGDVEWSKKWQPISIPGHPGVVMRMLSRTEWVNPTGAGKCPNVTGGCKLKAGGDVQFRNSDGTPFLLSKTWFNRALQLYVYNATTKAWELKQDTGWQYAGSAAPAYMSSWTDTKDYGTAPNGAAWYFVRYQQRWWDGAAWHGTILDPNPANGRTGLGVWDPKPGQSAKPPYASSSKAPKVKAPKKPKDGSALDAPAPLG